VVKIYHPGNSDHVLSISGATVVAPDICGKNSSNFNETRGDKD